MKERHRQLEREKEEKIANYIKMCVNRIRDGLKKCMINFQFIIHCNESQLYTNRKQDGNGKK